MMALSMAMKMASIMMVMTTAKLTATAMMEYVTAMETARVSHLSLSTLMSADISYSWK